MNKSTHPFLQIISLIVSVAILMSLALTITIIAPVSFDEVWKEVRIPEGVSYSKGLDILQENGIINSRLGLLFMGKMTGADRQLKPGYYNLSASMSPLQIFDDLISGRTIQFSITIPEGATLNRIKEKFLDKGLLDDESWMLAYDKEFLSLLGINAPSLEGYIFPDTYNFSKGTDPRIIFKIMVQRLREVFNDEMAARMEEMGMTENKVLTLASIIEKEAIYNWERPLISAVYHNRLKKKMKLQADPTVMYGVKTQRKRIRYRDLRRKTPYNTYKIKGLPPGPIASPGLESINAALNPADVGYLFFVSKNDGTHFFSTTGEEHVKAVALYQQGGGEVNQ